MLNFLLIAVCLFTGLIVKKYKTLPDGSYKAVNAWVINIALPAVALKYLPGIKWDFSLLLPLLMPIVVWAGSYLFVNFLKKYFIMSAGTRAALFLTSGLGNTSFLGFPLTEAYYGNDGLQIAILCDQATFIVMATFGIITATKASNGGKFDTIPILKKIFRFPPFIAFCLALLLPPVISFEPIEPLLNNLAATLIPLALFSVGLQIELKTWRKDARFISYSLLYKLILAPLILLLICFSLGIHSLTGKVTIFEAAMAPMVTGSIIAADYNLNPQLANIILSIGIPISFATTFLWFLLLEFF